MVCAHIQRYAYGEGKVVALALLLTFWTRKEKIILPQRLLFIYKGSSSEVLLASNQGFGPLPTQKRS